MPLHKALEYVVYLIAVGDLALFSVAASIFTLARAVYAKKPVKGKSAKA